MNVISAEAVLVDTDGYVSIGYSVNSATTEYGFVSPIKVPSSE